MPITANPRGTILLVNDDPMFAEVLRGQLTARGYDVYHAVSAAEAEARVDEVAPDLVVLDLLPYTRSLVLCANLREHITAPIIICTGPKQTEDLLLGLKLGADDVVSKPFSSEEFGARVEVALRRRTREPGSSATSEGVQVIGRLAIDRARYRVTLGGDPIHLTPTEYRLLCALAERPNHVLSSRALAERVWESPDADIRRSLESHVRRLRAKLNSGPAMAPALTTVRGFGYELTYEPSTSEAHSSR